MPADSILKGFESPSWNLARAACKKDNTSLVALAISETSEEDDPEGLIKYVRRHAIQNNAVKILMYIIEEHGASVRTLLPCTEISGRGRTSKSMLEILLANGWDINWRQFSWSGPDAEPFMWHVVDDADMVAWCLEHGASVFPMRQEPLRDNELTPSQRSCPPILERAAARGSVATFELLRSKGAPLGCRPLHLAIGQAAMRALGDEHEKVEEIKSDNEKAEGTESEDASKYAERMAMVHHLIDVIGLDVNALDRPVGERAGDRIGEPIRYIATDYCPGTNTRELTWLLLDRGADPAPGLEEAKWSEHPRFAEDVEAWKAQHHSGLPQRVSGNCNIQ